MVGKVSPSRRSARWMRMKVSPQASSLAIRMIRSSSSVWSSMVMSKAVSSYSKRMSSS